MEAVAECVGRLDTAASELERLVDKDFRFEGLTDSVEDGHNYEGETDAAKDKFSSLKFNFVGMESKKLFLKELSRNCTFHTLSAKLETRLFQDTTNALQAAQQMEKKCKSETKQMQRGIERKAEEAIGLFESMITQKEILAATASSALKMKDQIPENVSSVEEVEKLRAEVQNAEEEELSTREQIQAAEREAQELEKENVVMSQEMEDLRYRVAMLRAKKQAKEEESGESGENRIPIGERVERLLKMRQVVETLGGISMAEWVGEDDCVIFMVELPLRESPDMVEKVLNLPTTFNVSIHFSSMGAVLNVEVMHEGWARCIMAPPDGGVMQMLQNSNSFGKILREIRQRATNYVLRHFDIHYLLVDFSLCQSQSLMSQGHVGGQPQPQQPQQLPGWETIKLVPYSHPHWHLTLSIPVEYPTGHWEMSPIRVTGLQIGDRTFSCLQELDQSEEPAAGENLSSVVERCMLAMQAKANA